jgi:hypothetical protein
MTIDGPHSSAPSEWFSRYLVKIGMKTDEISVYLQPRNIKDCHPGVGEFDGLAKPKFFLQPEDYRAGAQNRSKKTGFSIRSVLSYALGNLRLKGWRFRR